jgi:hypothetical protein
MKNGPRIQPAFTANGTQISQPHYAMGSPPPAIFVILPFACHNQPSTIFATTSNIRHQNNQAQAPAYYQSYHYATTNHPQFSPTPQITYPPAVPQIRYPMPNNTNPHVNTEANPPPPPPHKSKSLRNSLTPSPPTAQSSQLSEVPTLILIPRDSVETITYKSIM